MMNLSDVHAFIAVAATQSFTKAARRIGGSRSSVSKKISRLEQDLGVVLINRTPRSVSLTEAGRIFRQHTADLDTELKRAADLVRGADLEPCGTVALSVPSCLGAALMPALFSGFQVAWPELRLCIHLEDREVDLITENYDLAIRISQKLNDSTLISRRLLSTRKVMAASPGYLTKFGIPGSISELSNHRCLGLGNAVTTGTTWRVFDEGTITNLSCQFSLSTNSNYSLMQTACLDNGIVYLPELCISNELAEERLIRILPGSTDPEPYGVFAVYPHRNAAAKVRVLVDFIEQHLCSMADTDRSDQMLDHSLSASGASVIQEDARQLI